MSGEHSAPGGTLRHVNTYTPTDGMGNLLQGEGPTPHAQKGNTGS